VCFKEWNRLKRNKTPFGAFSDRSDWPEILQRAQALPKAWSWRFEPDALERFKQDSDFQARQLTDTQYLSRVARQYLNSVCGDVWVTPGRLTQMLRGRWGLNSLVGKGDDKDRHDHRHHALDAFVIGVTTRGLLHRISTAAGRAESGASNKLMDESPDPFEGFDRHKLSTLLDRTIIAHRMDHGTGGALHEETAYGIIPPAVQEDGYNLVFRKPLISLSMGEIDRIRDKTYRTKIKAAIESDLAAFDGDPSKFKLGPTLARMGEELNIRRIRLLKKDESVIPITGKTGRPYKALTPGDNHHVDFWAVPGKEKWVAIGLSLFEAARGGQTQRPHPAAKKVMTLHKGDLVEMDGPTGREVMRVCGLRVVNGILQLAGHRESGKLQQRHDDKNDPFTWTFISFNQVQAKNLRKIWVGPLGKKS
jgi:CRISPR-associated endonuclease Csn1